MKKRIHGLEEARKILQGLDQASSERILGEIEARDPGLAEKLRNNLVTFEDLIYLTPKMIQSLTKEVGPSLLGLAFRAASEGLINHFMHHLPSLLKQEILEIYKGPPRRISEVEEAKEKILELIKIKIQKGEIVLDKEGSQRVV